MLSSFGLEPDPDQQGNREVLEFTRENILKQLEEDVDFGNEKPIP